MNSTVALVDSLYGKPVTISRAVEVAIQEGKRSEKKTIWNLWGILS